jgi:hypothetical protein
LLERLDPFAESVPSDRQFVVRVPHGLRLLLSDHVAFGAIEHQSVEAVLLSSLRLPIAWNLRVRPTYGLRPGEGAPGAKRAPLA